MQLELTPEEVDYICRHVLLPRRDEWKQLLVSPQGSFDWTEVAKSNIQKIESLFVKLGWWSSQEKINA